ncbi:MAG TPA: PadR family transcriptional regulator [Nitrososphaerales archaeon]|nr:PadR family transcriptional regulator [Nitrososphaerales archaeon]
MSGPSANDDNQDDRRHYRPWGNPGFLHGAQLRRIQFGKRGFLRPQILELLEKQPANGVDIMDQLQEMSHGWYRPSPGAIYPLLDELQKEGLVAKNEDGKFELTAAYAEQSGIGDNLATALSAMESNTSYLEDLRKTDTAGLSKSRQRIQKLAERLETLASGLEKGNTP